MQDTRLHCRWGAPCTRIAFWVVVSAVSARGAETLGTALTYQGQLRLNGGLVSDTCDCLFSLWDDPAAGAQVGPTLTFDGQGTNPPPISLSNGLLSVALDFGASAFGNEARWLEIAVACPSGGPVTLLSPRQPITPTPYALQTRGIFVDSAERVALGDTDTDARLNVRRPFGPPGDNHYIFVGRGNSTHLEIDDNFLQARSSTNVSTLDINPDGGAVRLGGSAPRVGVGLTNPQLPFQIVGGTGMTLTSGGYAQLGSTTGSNLAFDDNEVMARNNGGAASLFLNRQGGNVGIGTGAPSEKLQVAGNIRVNGNVFASCGTLTCSDARYKTDLRPIDGALKKVARLRPVSYEWKRDAYPDRQFSEDRQVGLIAQEVREILPEVVHEGRDGYLSIDYGRITPLLIEAARELKDTIDQKEARITRQERMIQELSARLERVEELMGNDTPSQEDAK